MSTLKVVFFGLISHVGRSYTQKMRAVLIRDDEGEHWPRIHFSPSRQYDLADNQNVEFNSKQDALSIGGDFMDLVPHLSALSEGSPSNAVLDGTDFNAARAYVRYPGGRLEVFDVYEDGAHYKLKKKKVLQCVARMTVLTFTRTDAIEVTFTTRDGEQRREDVSDQCILITNAVQIRREREKERNVLAPHLFKVHRKVVGVANHEIADLTVVDDACEKVTVPPHELCSWIPPVIRDFVDATEIECGNTQYP